MSISENIKSIRKSKKMTQQEVADILKVNRLAFARLETMENDLTFNQIVNIAGALGVSINELLDGVGVADTLENKEYDKLKNDYEKLHSEHEEWRADTIKLMDQYEILNFGYVQSKNEVSTILSRVENLLETLYSNTELEMGIDYDSETSFKMISKDIFRANSLLCIVLFDTLNIVKSSKWIAAWVREKALYEIPKIEDIIKLMKQYKESDEDSFIRILKQVDKQRGYKFTDDEIEDALEKYRDYKGFFAPQYI
jgi:transcriptional regulator with XRE-family HTH domain